MHQITYICRFRKKSQNDLFFNINYIIMNARTYEYIDFHIKYMPQTMFC